jgi:HlyD family secretion protein
VKRLLPILAVLAAVAAVAATAYFWPFRRADNLLHLPGTVEIQEVRIGSKVGGRVASVSVREGQVVEPGQEIVRFEEPELEAQRDQLRAKLAAAEADLLKARNGPRPEEKDEARAALAAAEARLQRMEAGWREEEKRQARNDAEAAEADFQLWTEEYARVESLAKQGRSVSQSEFDTVRANRDRARGRYQSSKAKLDMMSKGNRPEDIAEAQAERDRMKAKAALLDAGTRAEDIALAEAQVAETRARLNEVETNLREAVVRAPERILIEVLAVRKGDLLPPNQPVARVLRADDLWVKVFVPSTELGKVRLNDAVDVTVDSYPGRRFQGKIEQIASESEFTPRNVQSVDERRHQVFAVKVRVADPEGVFKSGMAAEVSLPLREVP